MIGIINYGLGNLNSIQNIISHVGGSSKIINHPDDIGDYDQYILPGVGAFDQGVNGLQANKWIDKLEKRILIDKVPLLGICLGMQLLCRSSEEGKLNGLGWIDAEVKKFSFTENQNLKVPHMGWNTVRVTKQNLLIQEDGLERRFYFVHSYYVECNDRANVLATSFYGHDFDASFSKGNIYGVQFHPEKSHKFGMQIIKNFIKIPC
jgi:glutamine amidotransferase